MDIGIHRVVSVTREMHRLNADGAWITCLCVTEKSGAEHLITLFADAPLDVVPEPRPRYSLPETNKPVDLAAGDGKEVAP